VSNPKASIIITSYNQPEYLKLCIDSCVNQTYENIEIIIGDDNSSNDAVWDVINSYSDERVISFNSKISDEERPLTARYATQINTAVMEYSSGKYLFYLPDDDLFYPDKVRMQIEHAEEMGVDVNYAAQDFVDASGRVAGTRYDGTGETSGRWEDDPGMWGGADAFFWSRLSRAGYKFYPLPFLCLSAKRYREHSVQWNVAQNLIPWKNSQ